eukprot:scaffold1696_cov258-Pinguiococcus_pyrenoidosus.AAC.27
MHDPHLSLQYMCKAGARRCSLPGPRSSAQLFGNTTQPPIQAPTEQLHSDWLSAKSLARFEQATLPGRCRATDLRGEYGCVRALAHDDQQER